MGVADCIIDAANNALAHRAAQRKNMRRSRRRLRASLFHRSGPTGSASHLLATPPHGTLQTPAAARPTIPATGIIAPVSLLAHMAAATAAGVSSAESSLM